MPGSNLSEVLDFPTHNPNFEVGPGSPGLHGECWLGVQASLGLGLPWPGSAREGSRRDPPSRCAACSCVELTLGG
eukprot:3788635-Alexandrium_andersonii.AAC.1